MDQRGVHVLIDRPELPPVTSAFSDWSQGRGWLKSFSREYLCPAARLLEHVSVYAGLLTSCRAQRTAAQRFGYCPKVSVPSSHLTGLNERPSDASWVKFRSAAQ